MDVERRIERFKSLPRQNETWQGANLRMPTWVNDGIEEPYRPIIPLWLAVRRERISQSEIVPPKEASIHSLVDAMLEFAADRQLGGYRPATIEVTDSALAEHLQGLLRGSDTEVRLVVRLDELNGVLAGFAESQGARQARIPSLLEGKGILVEHVHSFAQAAAEFYRAEPWRHLTNGDWIRVDESTVTIPDNMCDFVVLGAGHETYGLGFFKDQPKAGGAWPVNPDRASWHVSFDLPHIAPMADVDLWEQHGFPVGGKAAYPSLFEYSANKFRRPALDRLSYAEGLLRALATMTEEDIDAGLWSKEVKTSVGKMRFTLTLPDLLKPPTPQQWMSRGFPPDRRSMEKVSAGMMRYFERNPAADVDEMNRIINQRFVGKAADELFSSPDTLQEQAQDLCYQAFDTHGRSRVRLAKKALEIDSNCADAYVILAEQVGTREAELNYFFQAVAVGERSLPKELFHVSEPKFWGLVTTRPYMRARLGLAHTLQKIGRSDEAIEHYQALIKLNPGDNQGVRYLLMPLLMRQNRDSEAATLLKQYDDETANSAYSRALLAFRLSGSSPAARNELRAAFAINQFVSDELRSLEKQTMPHSYTLGTIEEAIVCADELQAAFVSTEGAMEWLTTENNSWLVESKKSARKKLQQTKKNTRDHRR